jgi:hypothetical protein
MFRYTLALVLCGLWATAVLAAEPAPHQGKVVGVGDGTIMIVDMTDGDTESIVVPKDCTITLDGQPAKLHAIQVGFTVEILADQVQDSLVAKTIRASSKLSPRLPL